MMSYTSQFSSYWGRTHRLTNSRKT